MAGCRVHRTTDDKLAWVGLDDYSAAHWSRSILGRDHICLLEDDSSSAVGTRFQGMTADQIRLEGKALRTRAMTYRVVKRREIMTACGDDRRESSFVMNV